MADMTTVTVKVSVNLDINGVPVTEIYEAPATREVLDERGCLRVNLHLDGRKLAQALLPHIHELLRQQTGIRDFARYYSTKGGEPL